MNDAIGGGVEDAGASTLVVLLHAYQSSPARLEALRHAVESVWPRAEVLVPALPTSLFSMADPDEVVERLLITIDEFIDKRKDAGSPIARINLVGHSIGGLLARKLYVVACGESPRAPFGKQFAHRSTRPWAGIVERIVLFAGMNRGWRITHHLSLLSVPLWSIGAVICHFLHAVRRRWPLIHTVRQGAEFITELRVQWLVMRQEASRDRSHGGALTIQLLGSRDDMVAPEDNVDLVSGGDFFYLDVPYSGHGDIIELDDPTHGRERREAFLEALTASREDLERAAVVPSDERFTAPDLSVTNVLFVIHGIRDVGYWTHKIARRVKQRAGAELSQWATETSSYGYFPLLPFIFPWYRRKKVEWLMDQYTEALARYPNASFHYIGHSNGTYLLAKALELYPCCRFKHIVFAGSVVRRQYDWRRFLKANPARVHAILNFVATRDWVVAFFPKFFQFFGLQDVGSAGHDGFAQREEPGVRIYGLGYVSGGHSAAIREPVWDVIADFVLRGEPSVAEIPGQRRRRAFLVWIFGLCPPIVWAGIAYTIWLIGTGVAFAAAATGLTGMALGLVTGLALSAYALVLWLILTRI